MPKNKIMIRNTERMSGKNIFEHSPDKLSFFIGTLVT